MKENEKDNFNAIQHLDLWSSHLTLGKIHASTVLRLLNRCLGDDCTWTLTADTYITSLKGDASCIKANGHRLFVGGKELKVNRNNRQDKV